MCNETRKRECNFKSRFRWRRRRPCFSTTTATATRTLLKNICTSFYSGTRLIWTLREHAKVSVLTGVRIERVNFRENVRAFPCRDKRNCPQYPGFLIKQVSVERGSTVFVLLRDYFNSSNLYKHSKLPRKQIDRRGVRVKIVVIVQ